MARQIQFLEGDIQIFETKYGLHSLSYYLMLRKELNKKLGQDGLKLIYSIGKQNGFELAKNYSEKFQIRGFESINFWTNIVELKGISKIKQITPKEDGTATIILESPFAKKYKEQKEQTDLPIDEYLAGFLAGILSVIYAKNMDCVESKCISMGSEFCEFIAKPNESKTD